MPDPRTIAWYDAGAHDYAEMVERHWPTGSPWLDRFAARLAPGARVLDFGAGPGWAAAALARRGFSVEATDASAGLAAEGRRRYGIEIRVAAFDALDAVAAYDGVWASFSLLHDSRDAFPGHLARIARALRRGGAIYLGMKEGTGTRRDSLGRRYFYVSEAEIRTALAAAGFAAPEIGRETAAGMTGMPEPMLHALAARATEAAP